MKWPWSDHAEVEKARMQEKEAEAARKQAEQRSLWAEQLAEKSRASTNSLRRQIELNGWTELLQRAWGSR